MKNPTPTVDRWTVEHTCLPLHFTQVKSFLPEADTYTSPEILIIMVLETHPFYSIAQTFNLLGFYGSWSSSPRFFFSMSFKITEIKVGHFT